MEALRKNMKAHSTRNGGNFPRGEAKGTWSWGLIPSRTEVQNPSMAGIRIHLHILHNKIGKTEAGMDRVSSNKTVICEFPCFVRPDISVSRYFTLFHGIPPYMERETGTYLKLSQTVTSTPLPNQVAITILRNYSKLYNMNAFLNKLRLNRN